MTTGEKFVQNGPEAENVAAQIEVFAANLFRRHVVQRSRDGTRGRHDTARLGVGRERSRHLSETEV